MFPDDWNLGVGAMKKDPKTVSSEKSHLRWLDDDGKLSLHHLDNITLTRDCFHIGQQGHSRRGIGYGWSIPVTDNMTMKFVKSIFIARTQFVESDQRP